MKSENSHRLKALLGVRPARAGKRALGSQVRGLYKRSASGCRPFGIRLPSRQDTKNFVVAVTRQCTSVTALMEALAAIEGQIARL